mgnify:FL=1|jgi:RNase P subunit RPR2
MSFIISAMLPQSEGDYCKYCDTPFTQNGETRYVIELDNGTWFICDECHELRMELAKANG